MLFWDRKEVWEKSKCSVNDREAGLAMKKEEKKREKINKGVEGIKERIKG